MIPEWFHTKNKTEFSVKNLFSIKNYLNDRSSVELMKLSLATYIFDGEIIRLEYKTKNTVVS